MNTEVNIMYGLRYIETVTIDVSDYEWAKTIIRNHGRCECSVRELIENITVISGDYTIGHVDCNKCPFRSDDLCGHSTAREKAKEIVNREVRLIIETEGGEGLPL